MKSFAILAIAGLAAAQADLASLPQCGQTCISNMIGVATSAFGCSPADINCFCTNQDFGYGVRDCSQQACANPEDAGSVIAFGTQFCAERAQQSGAPASAISSGALGVLSSALESATGSAASGAASATSSAASAASSITSSLASDASSVTSSLASDASSVTSSLASEASSISSSLASDASSAASRLSSALESATSSAASAAASATESVASEAGAPMITGMPVAGAAGLVAWLLL